jgi:hypothetical protein
VKVGHDWSLDLPGVFSYHAPHGNQATRYVEIRQTGLALANTVARMCPESPERSTAIAKIREAVMWANAAIACNEKEESE